jgi:hypothetical protein
MLREVHGRGQGLAQLRTMPSRLKQLPSRLKKLPSRLKQLPSRLKTVPARLKTVPAQLKKLPARLRAALAQLPGLLRRHRLFSIVLVVAVIPRVIVMLGYQPAVLFRLDTYDYLWGASHLTPNPVNPSGYSLFLWLLRPFHSLALIAGIQHLLGLAVAVMMYAVLRRYDVAAWLATLATVPVLFTPSQLLLEQLIMADLLALVLMVAGLALLLPRGTPSVRRSVVAGLLMGASVIVRPTSLPLVLVMAGFLLLREAGWRRVCAVLVAGAVPMAGYALWFYTAYGSFNLTNSNGLFLWSRTMTFANCAVIRPPADLRALCPGRQPVSAGRPAIAQRELPKRYLWDHADWQWQPSAKGLVPDTAAFTPAKNARALRFALDAIGAQPLSYLFVVAQDSTRPFVDSGQFLFPASQSRSSSLGPRNRRYMLTAVRDYLGTTSGIGPYLGRHLGTHLRQPYARLVQAYQRVIYLPDPVFALIFLVGLVGIMARRRHSAVAVLLWLSAVLTIVLPVAEHEYTYRYVIPAIPLACMAAALAFAKTAEPPAASAATAAASSEAPVSTESSPA